MCIVDFGEGAIKEGVNFSILDNGNGAGFLAGTS